MIIAAQLLKDNIVEYIIYIKHIQNIIRACNFDIDILQVQLIDKYEQSNKIKLNIRDWYIDIINQMESEGVKNSGDINLIKQHITELNMLHLQLLEDTKNYKYLELYNWAKPNIIEYKKLSLSNIDNEVELCINAIYSLSLLKLENKAILEDTAQSMQTFSNILAYLAASYKKTNY